MSVRDRPEREYLSARREDTSILGSSSERPGSATIRGVYFRYGRRLRSQPRVMERE